MRDKIKKILAVATEEDGTRLRVTMSATLKNLTAYNNKPSSENLKNLQKTEEDLASMVTRLSEKYLESSGTLKNILAVVDYLTEAGWKSKKSAAYKHKKEGKLTCEPDGTFLISKVDKYAARWLERKDGSSAIDALVEEKAKAELEKLKAQARHWDTKTKIQLGEYVPREEFEYAIAARAKTFKTDMEGFFRGRASEIVRVCQGDPELVPDLIEYLIDQSETWLDRYSKDKVWKVKLIKDNDLNA